MEKKLTSVLNVGLEKITKYFKQNTKRNGKYWQC